MAEKEVANTGQFQQTDFNTRIRDLSERNKLIRERVLLLGKNLVSSRSEMEGEISVIKSENNNLKHELQRMRKTIEDLSFEFSKFVKRDELILLERMLKDFQPLEFTRRRDVEELIKEHMTPAHLNRSIQV